MSSSSSSFAKQKLGDLVIWEEESLIERYSAVMRSLNLLCKSEDDVGLNGLLKTKKENKCHYNQSDIFKKRYMRC